MAFFLYKKFIKNRHSRQTSNEDSIHELVHADDQRSPTKIEPASNSGNIGITADQRTQEKLSGLETSQDNGEDSQRKLLEKQQKKAASRYRWRLILGLVLPFSVQALDVTIIASALPFIASDFKQLSQLNWITSAFNICEASFIPFWGQFADVFGRYTAMQSALLITLIGAVLCSAAPVTAFPMLLVGRALQGIGCAGLLINTKVILADKVSLKENARNSTTFTFVGGIGYGVGPVVGGYLTQANWRYCFIINIPIAALGLVLVHFVLREELLGPRPITSTNGDTSIEISPTFSNKISTIDFVGQLFFLFGTGLFVLAITWAGAYYPWGDVKIIVPLVLSVVLISLFITWEYLFTPGRSLSLRYPLVRPMIPVSLIVSRNAGLLWYINFSAGMAMYAVFYFAGLYFVIVESLQPGEAGRNLIYYTPGLAVGAYAAMYACNVWPLKTWYPLAIGSVVEPIGVTLLGLAVSKGNLPWVYGMLGLTGVGTGIRFMPGTLHGIGYHRSHISTIVSLSSLSHALGGTIATSVMINVLNNYLAQRSLSFSSTSPSLEYLASLKPSEIAHFKQTAREGITLAFYASTAFLWLTLVVMCFLGNVKIGKEKGAIVEGEGWDASHLNNGDVLTKGSYVASWFRKEDRTVSAAESGISH